MPKSTSIAELKRQIRNQRRTIDNLVYWLLRAYIANHRVGWEVGPSTDEVFSVINRVLANHGICGHRDCDCGEMKRAGIALLKKHDREEWQS